MYFSDDAARSGWCRYAQSIEHPGLALPEGGLLRDVEEAIALCLIGRQRRPHECEPLLAIGILRPGELLGEDIVFQRRHSTHGKFQRERDEVRFSQRQAGNRFGLLSTRSSSHADRRRRDRDVAKR